IDVAAPPQPAPSITLRTARVQSLLGEPITAADSSEILGRLGFAVSPSGDALQVEVPYFRVPAGQREAGLIDAVARVHGLDKLPITLPARERAIGGLSPEQKQRRRAEDFLRDRGFNEAITYSFIAPQAIERLRIAPDELRGRVLHIANPL